MASISPLCFETFPFQLWDSRVQSAQAVKQCDMSHVYEGEIISKVGEGKTQVFTCSFIMGNYLFQ